MAVDKKNTKKGAAKNTKKAAPDNKKTATQKNASAPKKQSSPKTKETHGQQLSINITRKKRYKRSLMCRMTPYLLMIVAVILAICLVTVGFLDMADGAGVVGFYIQQFLCGLLGGGALLVPFLLFYIGIIWCLFHIKWREHHADPESESYRDYRKAKRKNIGNTIFSCLLLIIVSSIIGVFADAYSSVDIVDMWEGALDGFSEGGLLGSMISCLLVNAFEAVISLVILFTLAVLFVLLICGITPDYIVTRIQYNRMIRREERETEEEERYRLEYEEEQRYLAEEAARQRRMARAPEKQQTKLIDDPKLSFEKNEPTEKKGKKDRSVQDYIDDLEDTTPKEPEMKQVPGVKIGPSDDEAQKNKKSEEIPMPTDPEPPKHVAGSAVDYDDETPFDAREYKGVDDLLKNLVADENDKKKIPPKRSTSEEDKQSTPEGKPIDMSKMGTDEIQEDLAAVAPEEGAAEEEPEELELPYVFPPTDLLAQNKNNETEDYTQELQDNAQRLVETLRSFKVGISEITYSRGPTITRYELRPNAGTRVRAIANLVDDIALNLATSGVRIEAPIPNKPAVGIEVPNRNRATVYLRDLIENSKFSEAKSKLTSCLGMDQNLYQKATT